MSWPTFILEVSTLYIHHFLKTPTWKSISLWIEDALIKAIQFDSLGLGHKPKINHQTRDTLDGSHQNVTGIYTPNHNKASNWLVATLSISNLILCIGAGQYYLRFNSLIWSRIIHLKKKKNIQTLQTKLAVRSQTWDLLNPTFFPVRGSPSPCRLREVSRNAPRWEGIEKHVHEKEKKGVVRSCLGANLHWSWPP